MGDRYHCEQCGYKWASKKLLGKPAFCPSCRSRNITEISSSINLFGFSIKSNNNYAEDATKVYDFQKASGTCNHCGKDINGKYVGLCQKSGFFGCANFLCKNCAKVCRDCKKIYCPKHIKDHKCKG